MSVLQGKNIVLGISGGIAAYKSASLARLLVKAGAEVQVVMTPSAREFITPLTMSTLTGNDVISEFFSPRSGSWHSHVELGLWADAMVIAPATASTLAKMAWGVADNILITTYLSCRAQRFMAPAMDLDMFSHPSTSRSLSTLRGDGCIIIDPEEGELASHLVGKGRMAEPEKILSVLKSYFSATQSLQGQRVLITSGPTYERIDPVRFIGNYSTGKMGKNLAEVCAERGAQVTFISGPVWEYPTHPNIDIVKVESAREMYEECMRVKDEYSIGILCAAVADYRPSEVELKKIKREDRGDTTLTLVTNPDISKALGTIKQSDQYLVGFALETDATRENVQRKMERKGLDMIVYNSLQDKGAGFGTETNKVTILQSNGQAHVYGLKSKREVAEDIVNMILEDVQQ